MRFVLRILGSRFGIAALIVLAVVVTVALANDRVPTGEGPGGTAGNVDSETATEPGLPDDGIATVAPDAADEDDDSRVHDPYEEEELPDEAVTVATAFAEAWLNHTNVSAEAWHAGMAPYMTDGLANSLSGVDPEGVPAEDIAGEALASGSNVEIELDVGLLRLRMVERTDDNGDPVWLVDSVDWERP